MLEDLSKKRIAILGFGIEGIALANFLVDKVASITVFDQKSQELLLADDNPSLQKVILDQRIVKNLNFDINVLPIDDFDVIFRSPAIYFDHPKLVEARSRGIEVSSQIKLFFELCSCKIIGVTGTKGKGTTASLIFSMLEKAGFKTYLAGNIGYPAITLIPELKKDDFVILELSNFQLADLNQSPYISVVTNIGIDHLDYHKTAAEYVEAKFNILKYQTFSDYAVLNENSTFQDLTSSKARKLFFSRRPSDTSDAYLEDGQVLLRDGGVVCGEEEIRLVGKHNLENIAAASLVARILNIPVSIIKNAATDFNGLPYRLQLIREIRGKRFINDSFATNPGPTMAAIESFAQEKVLILGGSSKNADFAELAQTIAKNRVKAVILIGVEGTRIGQALKENGYAGIIMPEKSLEEAVSRANSLANSGEIIIFSPACASFDMFKNYKDRGEKFNQIVEDLKDE